MALQFGDLVAPVDDLRKDDPLASWRWLVGMNTQPLLLTAMGDMFVENAGGAVAFLDTYEGSLKQAGADRSQWKAALQDQNNLQAWFAPGLVEELHAKGLRLSDGQCFSPVHPPVLGGSMEPDNFECSSWRVHFIPMGQIHEQVKDLPPGTPITSITIDWK